MNRSAVIIGFCSLAGLGAAEERPDLLRFTNGDQLHGSFLGIKPGPQVVWQRDDLGSPVGFKTESLRHIVLRGGRPLKALNTLSHLGLVNGDRIPGTVTGMDADHITLDTSCAGMLKIPRGQIAIAAPNPLGGRVHYHGPFAEDDWTMKHPAYPEGLPETAAQDAARTDETKNDEAPGRWAFSGSAWYWRDKIPGTALIRETGMPDRAVLAFDLAWKNRLSIAIAFHADFAQARPGDEGDPKADKARAMVPGDSSDLPRLFGNSYVLQMVSNYVMLFRTRVDGNGETSLERVQLNNNNLRLGETSGASVELRSNRLSGGISLFINDEFVAQWSEGDLAGRDGASFAGKGSGFGFVVQGNESPVRISDIVVSEWNGMPDSARSLQVDDQDVVLMANGTDRYAGKVGALDEDGNVLFEGKHGRFRFPLGEVAEIRFARDHLATAAEAPEDNVIVRLNPIGAISGRAVSGDGSALEVLSPVIGQLSLSLESAVMLDFNSSNQFIDDWDADF